MIIAIASITAVRSAPMAGKYLSRGLFRTIGAVTALAVVVSAKQ